MANGESEIRNYVGEAFRTLAGRVLLPEISVVFHDFADLTHTIRIRQQKVLVRISDILRTAPPEVWRALSFLLVARLFRQPPPAEERRIYRDYADQPEVQLVTDQVRRQRGRKIGAPAVADQVYDLDYLFARLNRRYFQDTLPKPRLSWSRRPNRRILGHHDDVHDTIVISRLLNDIEIPDCLVEFVLYHEMLHLKHPVRVVGGRRIYHPAAFRRDEQRFEQYDEALAALERIRID